MSEPGNRLRGLMRPGFGRPGGGTVSLAGGHGRSGHGLQACLCEEGFL